MNMKKLLSINMIFVLLLLCGCSQENSDTRFLLDTVVNLKAECDTDTLNGAFALCEHYEKMLSRTVEGSDVACINNSDGTVNVSNDTAKIIKRATYYSKLSNGRFDITVYPVSSLWNFNDEIIPSRDEIAEALKNVDYQSIETDGNAVTANGAKIDLGGIAKGYIADRLKEYFTENGVKSGIINLGGNIVVFGKRDYTVGIKKPFSADEISATVKVKNKSVVTSGIYERYIEKDGKILHHILDPETGYPCDTDLYSATVIGNASLDCDALSTVCILEGLKKGTEIIESSEGVEAVFIDKDYNITCTSGLLSDGEEYRLK